MKHPCILIIDQFNVDFNIIQSNLSEEYEFIKISNISDLSEFSAKHDVGVILIRDSTYIMLNSINPLFPDEQFPIVMLSENINKIENIISKTDNYIDIIKKPFNIAEVKNALKNALKYSRLKKKNNLLFAELTECRNKEFTVLKNNILRNLSHEIRTPLNVIIGFSTLILSTDITENKKKHYSLFLEEASERLIGYIENLSELLRFETNNINAVNSTSFFIGDVFNAIIHANKRIATFKNILLEHIPTEGIDPSKIVIISDKHKIYTIFTKLIKSTIYHSENGSIKIGITNASKHYVKLFYSEEFQERYGLTLLETLTKVQNNNCYSLENNSIECSIVKKYINDLNGHYWIENNSFNKISFFMEIQSDSSNLHEWKLSAQMGREGSNKK